MLSSIFSFRKFKLLLLSMILFIEGNAQSILNPADLNNKLISLDSTFFDVFTSCNIEKLRGFFIPTDFEVYEKESIMTSVDNTMQKIKEGCSMGFGVKREVFKSSLQSCPVAGFGGILTGEHWFYIPGENGDKEFVQSTKFIEVWKQEGNDCKLTKLLFYDQRNTKNERVKPFPDAQTLARMDSSLFSIAYICKPDEVAAYFTDDLEFYHDMGGLTKTLPAFIDQLKNNFCGEGKVKLRRELVKGSLQTYAIKNGAIQAGEHRFYVTPPGEKEFLSGVARFIHIWKNENGKWKISRVLSLDHKPAQ